MDNGVKITSLELENVKRIKAVQLAPAANGLTVIGGNNRQGKTSVLDAIAWALGGDRYKPTSPMREGSTIPPRLRLEMNNGLVVERSGKNSTLKVTDPTGRKGGQQLLNEFVEQLALDIPTFVKMTDKEKSRKLLDIIGVGDKLFELDNKEKSLYNRRLEIGRIADQKAKYAKEMPMYADVPKEPVSVSDLIREQQDILARNGENQRKRMHRDSAEREYEEAEAAFEQAQHRLSEARAAVEIARKSAQNLVDESTAEIEESIQNVESINAKIRANCEREKAELDAEEIKKQYDSLSAEIEETRNARTALLNGAKMPLEGLEVKDGILTYNGAAWDCMSGAEQLIVSTSIVRELNPKCGFVLLDGLEQMDMPTLEKFGQWLQQEGLQAIATRVSTGEECSIIIEDGLSHEPVAPKTKTWKAGVF